MLLSTPLLPHSVRDFAKHVSEKSEMSQHLATDAGAEVWRDDDRIASIYGIHGQCCALRACSAIRIILHAVTSATIHAIVCPALQLRIALSGNETAAHRLLLGDFPPPAELQPLYTSLRVRCEAHERSCQARR